MGHRDLPPVLRKFGIALTRPVAADRPAGEFRCQLIRHPERTQVREGSRAHNVKRRVPHSFRVLCGKGGRRNSQPATPVPTAPVPARHLPNSSVILNGRKSVKDLARTTSTPSPPNQRKAQGAPPLSAFSAERVGDETLNQQRQSLLHRYQHATFRTHPSS
jgi:hypothetical protein